ncbi:MAG TPA: hypothetical protein VL463_15230 [Kofleriaceae bacterium]|jgi:hypothetical protein|nr:hypothetical protein [Kofleriaceae bacterium]
MRWLLLLAVAGCGAKARSTPTTPRSASMPVPTVQVGSCSDPDRDGVVSPRPDLKHADRDLDGDGQNETISADRAMCTAEGNCYWNVFVHPAGQCPRFAGTLAGARLEPLATRGDQHFLDVRGYWTLTSGNRFLVEEYRFVRGGYQSQGALLCRREDDDRLQCSEDPR